ncbi:MAG: LamB/YcsF family protein [Coriobacteriia bacterium]|nr:LamB/YcsF family protein [Coriobacteriia bacterium]
MLRVDLNCDLGETTGNVLSVADAQIIPLVTSVNVACGAHAGIPALMRSTMDRARECGVAVGAHPGFPDREGFGREPMQMTPDEIAASVTDQIGTLAAIARDVGVELQHVKAHGALYNIAVGDFDIAIAIGEAIKQFDNSLIYCGMTGTCMEQAARSLGLLFIGEAFADRAYSHDRTLVSRAFPGAVIEDGIEVASRAVKMVRDGIVTTVEGSEMTITAQTLCLHGDNPNAVALAGKIRSNLTEAGIDIVPMSQIVEWTDADAIF